MPQITSAKKALRQSARRRVVNDRWRKKLRLAIRAVTDALSGNDREAATKALPTAQKMIDRATRHGILHKNTAGRRKAKLARAVHTIDA